MQISTAGLAYAEKIPAGLIRVVVDNIEESIAVPAGESRAVVLKDGPCISSVEPAAGAIWPLVLTPGMLVSIKGRMLNGAGMELRVAGKPVEILSASEDNVSAVMPDGINGPAAITSEPAGQSTTRVYFEPGFPALFTRDGTIAAIHAFSGETVSPSNPAAPGEIIALFLTGLGRPFCATGFASPCGSQL